MEPLIICQYRKYTPAFTDFKKANDVVNDLSESKRKINRAIAKNKGLTELVNRKKEDRNPRVKHRGKFEKAKKKLGSTKPLYRDDKSSAPYGGEKTGIRKNISKSVKF